MLIFFNVAIGVMWAHIWYVEGNGFKARSLWVKYFVCGFPRGFFFKPISLQMVWGWCMAMRAFSIVLTSMPATENHCQNPKTIDNMWVNAAMGFFTFGGKNVHCGDLLFSGHTINILNAFLALSQYGRKFTLFILCAFVCSLICLFLIIASRSHYTIDVYIAVLISYLNFSSTPDSIPWFLMPIHRFIARFVQNTPLLPSASGKKWAENPRSDLAFAL